MNNPIYFIDSHAHLSSLEVWPHLNLILERARLAHISHIMNICTDLDSLSRGIDLADRYSFIKNAGATTPQDVAKEADKAFSLFEETARKGSLAAIGETGLDYHYQQSPKELQKHFFKKYLRLAALVHLPVIFHCREAFADLFAITDEEYQGSAILHCFTGTPQEAEEVLKRGWYLSLSGIVTFKKSESLRTVAKFTPVDQLLIETDTPYLAPHPYRGRLNEPSYLLETARIIAEVKQIDIEQVANATSQNAKKIFGFV